MSYSRTIYDKCAYAKQLQESVSPLEYQLNPQKYEHCKKCRIELGVVGGTNVSHADGNLVDVESDLRNITRASSRCPGRKFNPSCDIGRCKAPGYPCGGGGKVNCDNRNRLHLNACQLHNYKHLDFKVPEINIDFCSPAPIRRSDPTYKKCN
jgi:hypothetical protein